MEDDVVSYAWRGVAWTPHAIELATGVAKVETRSAKGFL